MKRQHPLRTADYLQHMAQAIDNNVVKNDPSFANAHTAMPWGFAYEMRNSLAHGYFKVDLDIVWATVIADLPGMKAQLAVLDKTSIPRDDGKQMSGDGLAET